MISNTKIAEIETSNSIYFWDYNYPLSNFYLKDFTHKNKTFISAQHAILWEMAVLFKDYKKANEILTYGDKSEIKDVEFINFNPIIWVDENKQIYESVLTSKFTSSELMRELLLSTRQKNLVFCSPDKYWGCGLRTNHPHVQNPKKWTGSNNLGEILMKVRNNIK